VLNFNTGRRSWWFTSSFGCSKQIALELEQLQSQENLNILRNIIETSTPITTTTAKSPNSIAAFNLSTVHPAALFGFNSNNHSTSSSSLFKLHSSSSVNSHSYRILEQFIQAYCFIPFYVIEIIQCGVLVFLSVNFYFFTI
jgi:hypothetical protein